MAIYLKLADIKGNVTAAGFEDQIAIDSLTFGVGRGITMEAGNMSNREATRPSLSEVSVSKMLDNSATALFKGSVTGAAGQKAVFTFVRTGADQVDTFMTYELEDCLISSYQMSAQGDGEPVENISFSFSKLLVEYIDNDKSNAAGSKQVVGYDLTTAKPL